jgi:hypothetical protein
VSGKWIVYRRPLYLIMHITSCLNGKITVGHRFAIIANHYFPLSKAVAGLNMPWIEFEKSEEELGDMFTQIFEGLECVIFETYSILNFEIEAFDSAESLNISVTSLIRSHGTQLSIWCSNVMPRPQFRNIELRDGGSRQAVDGCGLFSVQLEGPNEGNTIVGKIGYFTESAANRKYTGLNGPELVNWDNHKQAEKLLRKAIVLTSQPANKSSKKDALKRASS